jgi:two-component system, OmpR family, response regulator VicR
MNASAPAALPTILYAEDDKLLAEVTLDNLKLNGFEVFHATNGDDVMAAIRRRPYDIILLDVGMPGKNGFEVAHDIRLSDERTPIIFVTARSMPEDRIHGLKLGADDYIIKPYSMEELVLKIRVMIKRINHPSIRKANVCNFGDCTFQIAERRLTVSGQQHLLTSKEADILRMLVERAGDVLRRDDILLAVWQDNTYFNGRSLDVFMSKLRKLLKPDESIQILSLHGIGYRLITEGQVQFLEEGAK